jgi:hypothetical protein
VGLLSLRRRGSLTTVVRSTALAYAFNFLIDNLIFRSNCSVSGHVGALCDRTVNTTAALPAGSIERRSGRLGTGTR